MGTNDESYLCNSGYITPPLSPTKTISTEGWLSPKTPASPRKSRSCLFVRDIDSTVDSPFTIPPSSPTKSKVISRLGVLPTPEFSPRSCDIALLQSDDILPAKRATSQHTGHSSPHRAVTLAPSHTHPPPQISQPTGEAPTCSSSNSFCCPPQYEEVFAELRQNYRSLSDGQIGDLISQSPTNLSSSWTESTDDECLFHPPSGPHDLSFKESPLPNQLCRISPRCATSPLRPSQWMARGGSLPSSRRYQTGTPDRFIASRRPPAATRESFELGKPVDRREGEYITPRNRRLASDPFDRRLRRSERLNDELRGLREAHSIILGRASGNRGNTNFRQTSVFLSTRQISSGAVWNVGGPSAVSDTVVGVSTGSGGMLGVGTNAPLYKSAFLNRADPEAELEAYERRLALALGVDQTERVLQHSPAPSSSLSAGRESSMSTAKTVWRDGGWIKDGLSSLLDAPQLRDDYYCTLLAYSYTAKCLAVGLGDFVHLWSERSGVDTPECLNPGPSDSSQEFQHVTCLDFSSSQGNQAILAVGRADGRITLWSTLESEPRFDATQPKPISCVSWRPTLIQRPSLRDQAMDVPTEELLIGDEVGHIYFYSVEWPSETQAALFGWHGAMTLLARLTIHTQQICGLAWSTDGELFASGSNDNSCNLFETKKVLRPITNSETTPAPLHVRQGPNGESIYVLSNQSGPVLHLPQSIARYKWVLNAAVKAMAFCPWQRGLVAIGGGSNDRCIHFYHTRSGTCLATIDCAAQVTALIWSQTRREIAATFGFAQPEHPYRLAVFAWPSCEQIVAVPWWDENRALCAVAYPGGPTRGSSMDESREGGRAREEDDFWSSRSAVDGCIVVAASDMAIRFHEIWGDRRGSLGSGNLLGGTASLWRGSGIVEGLYGIEREGTVIR